MTLVALIPDVKHPFKIRDNYKLVLDTKEKLFNEFTFKIPIPDKTRTPRHNRTKCIHVHTSK